MDFRIKLLTLLCLFATITNAAHTKLAELNENSWRSMLEGEWMVEFYAPWCPACKSLAPTWEKFAESAITIGVNVAKIDVTKSPSLSGRFFVTALPTIYHVKSGQFRQYRGSRDGDALMYFIKQRQWEKVDPISAWKKPDSIQMTVLSYFFKLSHVLKDFNNRLHDEYGLPTWGSYALFAISTIFVGAILGLLLVCVVDFLYPPKKSQRQSFSETKENAVEDLPNDEIEDEIEDEIDDDIEGDGGNKTDDENDADSTDSTSNGEKISNSESEEQVENEQTSNSSPRYKKDDKTNLKQRNANDDDDDDASKNSSPEPTEVRKRKPRKAD